MMKQAMILINKNTPETVTGAAGIRFKKILGCALALALLGLASTSVQAISFSKGELTGSFDTTISYGASWRAGDLDEGDIGKAAINPFVSLLDNAGQRAAPGRWSVNNDDGTLNYPDGGDLFSNTIKFTSELDVRYKNYGAFTRFMGFYDFKNHNKDGPAGGELG